MRGAGVVRGVVVVAVVVAALGRGAPSVGAAAPALTVDPAAGLLDQQVVTVTGTGFGRHAWVIVAQCPDVTLSGCTLDPPVNTTGAYGYADQDGAFTATLRLSRTLGATTCSDGCSIVAVPVIGRPVELARTGIAFAPGGTAPPYPAAALTFEATDVRPDGVAGTWTGSGFRPGFETIVDSFDFSDLPGGTRAIPLNTLDYLGGGHGAYLGICRPGAGCERFVGPLRPGPGADQVGRHEIVPVQPDGTISAPGRLPRHWVTHEGPIDCVVEDCSFVLEQDDDPRSVVVDVAWALPWAPWPDARAFVVETWVALVGRVPTAAERSVAVAGLTGGSLDAPTYLRRLAARSDARPLAELTRLYQAALGRRPDGPGLLFWESEVRRTGSMAAVARGLARSREFKDRYEGGADAGHVVRLAYAHTLGRPPSPREFHYWVGRLEAGLAASHLVHLFSRTPELLVREAARSEATAVVVALTGRGPGEAAWQAAGPGRDGADEMVLAALSDDDLVAEVRATGRVRTD